MMLEETVEKVKNHVKRNKTVYLCVGTSVLSASFTAVIMRGVASRNIQGGTTVLAKGGTTVLGRSSVMNNVSYISAERQGSPSWVVRCKETGNIFPSQRSTASNMNLNESRLSAHLNGATDHVDGFHFERICMAA